jgi:hypothetical protein
VLYTTWFVCAKELLAKSERAVSEPQCHMGADSDNSLPKHNSNDSSQRASKRRYNPLNSHCASHWRIIACPGGFKHGKPLETADVWILVNSMAWKKTCNPSSDL